MSGFRDVREKTYIREKCPWPSYSSESDNHPDRLGEIYESDSLPERLELPDDSGDIPFAELPDDSGDMFFAELPDDSGYLPCPKW